MIGSKNISLGSSNKPILIFKQLPQIQLQPSHQYFIVSTLDKQVYLLEYNHIEQKSFVGAYNLALKQYLPTQLYVDPNSLNLYVGYLNGDVEWLSIRSISSKNSMNAMADKKKKPQENIVCRQLFPTQNSKIMLLYTRGNDLFAWTIGSTVKRISVVNGDILQLYNFDEQYCSSICFWNPATHTTVGCVSFQKYAYPIIFDCTKTKDFEDAYQLSLIHMKEEKQKYQQQSQSMINVTNFIQHLHQSEQKYQTYLMKQYYNEQEETMFIICGKRHKSEEIHEIEILQVIYEERREISVCETYVKFSISAQLLNISIKDSLIMLSMWEKLEFIRFKGLLRERMSEIRKKDLNCCWGFILSIEQNKIKFMYDKGFNFMYPQASKLCSPNIKIKSRIL